MMREVRTQSLCELRDRCDTRHVCVSTSLQTTMRVVCCDMWWTILWRVSPVWVNTCHVWYALNVSSVWACVLVGLTLHIYICSEAIQPLIEWGYSKHVLRSAHKCFFIHVLVVLKEDSVNSALEMFESLCDLMKMDVAVSPVFYRQASLASSCGTEQTRLYWTATRTSPQVTHLGIYTLRDTHTHTNTAAGIGLHVFHEWEVMKQSSREMDFHLLSGECANALIITVIM